MGSTSNFDWKNAVTFACGLGSAICISIGEYVAAGNALPWHVTAGMLVLATAIFGNISHSLLGSTGARDMHGAVAPGASAEIKQAALSTGQTLMPAAPTVPSRPPPPMFPGGGKALLVLVLAVGAMRLTTGCKDTTLPQDLVSNYQCVQTGIAARLTALQIEAQCLPGQLQTILNIVEGLLLSPQWRAANPDKIDIAEGVRSEAKQKMSEGAK